MRRIVSFSALALAMTWASSAIAQNRTGTVRITGRASSAIKLSFWDFTQTGNTSGATAAEQNVSGVATQDDPLAVVFDVGDIGAGATNPTALRGGTVTIALRSSATSYTLSAQAVATGTTTTVPLVPWAGTGTWGNDLTLQDFGWGIGAPSCSGVRCDATGGGTGHNPVPAFQADVTTFDPANVPLNYGGANVTQITTAQTIMTGGKISLQGLATDTTNALLLPTTYALAAGLYSPVEAFDVTITYTLANP